LVQFRHFYEFGGSVGVSEKTGADRELVKALSSKKDLVGDATEKAIEGIKNPGCPFSKGAEKRRKK